MIPISLTPDIDKAPWNDLKNTKELGIISRIGRLTKGTQSGKSVVMIAIKFEDGTEVVGQTTMDLFEGASKVMLIADGRSPDFSVTRNG